MVSHRILDHRVLILPTKKKKKQFQQTFGDIQLLARRLLVGIQLDGARWLAAHLAVHRRVNACRANLKAHNAEAAKRVATVSRVRGRQECILSVNSNTSASNLRSLDRLVDLDNQYHVIQQIHLLQCGCGQLVRDDIVPRHPAPHPDPGVQILALFSTKPSGNPCRY